MISKEEALADIIGVLPSDVIREYNGLYKVENRRFMVLMNSESDDIANETVRQMIADGIICYASGYYVYEI